MLSNQTGQYFPLYKFTWEKLQSTNEGTTEVKGEGTNKKNKLYWQLQGKLEKGRRGVAMTYVTGNQKETFCYEFENKYKFQNSYSIVDFKKQLWKSTNTICCFF